MCLVWVLLFWKWYVIWSCFMVGRVGSSCVRVICFLNLLLVCFLSCVLFLL